MSEINMDAAIDLMLWYGTVAMFMLGIWGGALYLLIYDKKGNRNGSSRKCVAPHCQCIWPTDCPKYLSDHTNERRDHGC